MAFTILTIVVGILTILWGILFGIQQYLYIRWRLQEKLPLNYFKCDKFNDTMGALFWAELAALNALGGHWFMFAGAIVLFLVYVARYEFFTRFAPKVNNVD